VRFAGRMASVLQLARLLPQLGEAPLQRTVGPLIRVVGLRIALLQQIVLDQVVVVRVAPIRFVQLMQLVLQQLSVRVERGRPPAQPPLRE
jgi:hypothetical protein